MSKRRISLSLLAAAMVVAANSAFVAVDADEESKITGVKSWSTWFNVPARDRQHNARSKAAMTRSSSSPSTSTLSVTDSGAATTSKQTANRPAVLDNSSVQPGVPTGDDEYDPAPAPWFDGADARPGKESSRPIGPASRVASEMAGVPNNKTLKEYISFSQDVSATSVAQKPIKSPAVRSEATRTAALRDQIVVHDADQGSSSASHSISGERNKPRAFDRTEARTLTLDANAASMREGVIARTSRADANAFRSANASSIANTTGEQTGLRSSLPQRASTAISARLQIGIGSTHQVQPTRSIRDIEVRDQRVCDAVHFSGGQLTFIGKTPGSTTATVWYEGDTAPTNYVIQVGAEQSDDQQAQREYSRLATSIAVLHPNSQIELELKDGKLIVRGTSANRHEAIKIMSMVRRTMLIPVIDELEVRKKP